MSKESLMRCSRGENLRSFPEQSLADSSFSLQDRNFQVFNFTLGQWPFQRCNFFYLLFVLQYMVIKSKQKAEYLTPLYFNT